MENEILNKLELINFELSAALRKIAEQKELNLTQANILNYIAANNGETTSGLAAKLALSKPTVSDSVKALRRKNLVEHTEGVRDTRIKNLSLTKQGEEVAEHLQNYRAEMQSKFAKLHMSEKSILLENLSKLSALIKSTS